VVLVEDESADGWRAYFRTDPSWTGAQMLELAAAQTGIEGRSAISNKCWERVSRNYFVTDPKKASSRHRAVIDAVPAQRGPVVDQPA
jgi:hypothetical protein